MSKPTPTQIRAARAMLDWSMLDLAKAAGVSISTVKRFEGGSSQPVSADTVASMRDTAETEGVRFLPDDGNGPGVRLRQRRGDPRRGALGCIECERQESLSLSVSIDRRPSLSGIGD